MSEFIKKVPQINIEKADLQDADDWATILHYSLQDTYSGYISPKYMSDNYNIEQLKEDFLKELDMQNSNTEMYMLKLKGNSVGILKIGKPIKYYSDGKNYYKDDIQDVGEIKSLHIKSDYQGQGIGSQAIGFAESRLKQLNYNECSIWVKMQNYKAIRFYSNLGYNKTNYINPNTNDKAPSVVMEKKLRIQTIEDNKQKKMNETTDGR